MTSDPTSYTAALIGCVEISHESHVGRHDPERVDNWLFAVSINRLHGDRYTDAMAMHLALKTQVHRDLELDLDEGFTFVGRLFHASPDTAPPLSERAAKRKLKTAEIPGDKPPHINGRRTLQIVQWRGALCRQVLREMFLRK